MVILKQMIVLFLLMMVGYICRKKDLINDESSKRLSGIVVNVANPALILMAGINPESTIGGMELLKTFGLAVIIFASTILIGYILPRLLKVKVNERGLYQMMMIFSNIGFMGFPLISAVYGNDALLYATFFLIPYNVLIYTYGIKVIKTSSGMVSEADEKASPVDTLKKIFNIGVIACILTFVLYTTKLPVPSFIESAVDYLSNLTAPLSMMLIGDSLTKLNIKELVTDWRLMTYMLVKMLVIPILGITLMKLCGITGDMLGVCMVMLATPVGSMTVMLAQQYDGDCELASKGVALSTVMSVVTIPIVALFV
jgi:hypothetical protein